MKVPGFSLPTKSKLVGFEQSETFNEITARFFGNPYLCDLLPQILRKLILPATRSWHISKLFTFQLTYCSKVLELWRLQWCIIARKRVPPFTLGISGSKTCIYPLPNTLISSINYVYPIIRAGGLELIN